MTLSVRIWRNCFKTEWQPTKVAGGSYQLFVLISSQKAFAKYERVISIRVTLVGRQGTVFRNP